MASTTTVTKTGYQPRPYTKAWYLAKLAAPAAKKRKVPTGYRLVRPERKLYFYQITDVPVDTTGNFVLLNGLTKGTDLYGQRIGARVSMTNIEIRGKVGHNSYMGKASATQQPPQVARLLVVMDKQTNGAVFSITDLLDQANSLSLYNGDGIAERYRILLDKSFVCCSVDVSAGGIPNTGNGPFQGQGVHFFHYKIPLKSVPVHYNNGNVGTVADIDANSVYMVWLGDAAASATAASTARVTAQLHYTDA